MNGCTGTLEIALDTNLSTADYWATLAFFAGWSITLTSSSKT